MSRSFWARRRQAGIALATLISLAAAPAAIAKPDGNGATAPREDATCSSGGHTLSQLGDHVYPEMGNDGYASLHTDVNLVYDAVGNEFLEGTNVVLTDLAEECLTDFSLDFERRSPETEGNPGTDLQVEAVAVNGQPASFAFVQPTYPGDPAGQDDPNPAAHEAGLGAHVSEGNPLPPACAPNVEEPSTEEGSAAVGEQCAANKLVVTPAAPIPSGETFEVEVEYAGHPGVHADGDASAEGWFRADDGSFVTTEPVGSEAWMPLNNHPTAKPTYDFTEQVSEDRTAIANGELVGVTHNDPDAQFPNGSTTWEWHAPEPIASYLVESSVGEFDLEEHTAPNGTIYYEAQSKSIPDAQKTANKAVMDRQQEITEFEEEFNGPFPFSANGVVVDSTDAAFEEEMQGKITFHSGEIALPTFTHENMHQWFGDNVSESSFSETFFKEGLARLSEYLLAGREAAEAAGGLHTGAGDAAFEASLVGHFNTNYAFESTAPRTDKEANRIWSLAPSDPTEETLFKRSTTYTRPGTAYIALRQILGGDNFAGALQQIQEEFGGGNISEGELEAVFQLWMPNQSRACHARLNTFFTEWFDTRFPMTSSDPTALKPQLTGPGLDPSASDTTFYNADGSCDSNPPSTTATVTPAPSKDGGKVVGPATVTLTAHGSGPGAISTEYSLDGGAFQPYTGAFTVAKLGAHTVEYRSTSRDGGVEEAKALTFTVIAAPVTPPPPVKPVCADPHLTVAVSRPLVQGKDGVMLLRGKAYRFTGRLTCGSSGGAPAGTAISLATVKGGQTTPRPGLAVGEGGKIDALLRFSGRTTAVFGFGSAQASVRIVVAPPCTVSRVKLRRPCSAKSG